MPDLRNRELIDDATVSNLLNRIDGYIRSNDNILGIVDEIDEIILVEIMGVDENVVREFRNIWLTLQRRRLNRR